MGARALQLLFVPGEPPRHGQRAFLHLFGQRDNGGAFLGRHETVGGPLKQRMAGCLFERLEASPDRWMTQSKRTGGASQRAGTYDGQNNSNITPLDRKSCV